MGLLSLVLLLSTAPLTSACREKAKHERGGSDVKFFEKTSTDNNKAGDPCSLPGARARSSASFRTVNVVDASGRKINLATEQVRVRKLRFPVDSVEPENYSGPNESSPLPGFEPPPSSSLPFKGKYHILLAPVLQGRQAVVRPETRIIIVSSDHKGADVRRTLIRITEETPIGQGTSRYFTTAFLPSEESTKVAMVGLAASGLEENSSIPLKSDRLDDLLAQSGLGTDTAHPTEGVMIELEPPSDGLQTDMEKLLLWFDGKSNAFNVSGNLVCER